MSSKSSPSSADALAFEPSSRLSYEQVTAGVKARLERLDPLGAWAFAQRCRRWKIFLDLSEGPLAPITEIKRPIWGGDGASWREAGERCAQECKKTLGEDSLEANKFLKSRRVEFFEGALTVYPERAWRARARAMTMRMGLDCGVANHFKQAMMTCSPDFQREMMASDWNGLQRAATRNSDGSTSLFFGSGIKTMAGWGSATPLKRAADFLQDLGLDAGALLTSSQDGSALMTSVICQSEPCARFILSLCSDDSVLTQTREAIERSAGSWEFTLGEEKARAFAAERFSFLERLSLDRELASPVAKNRKRSGI